MKDTITTLLIVMIALKLIDFNHLSAVDIIIITLAAFWAIISIIAIVKRRKQP